MLHRRPAALAALALTAGTSWLVATPAHASAAPTTCLGKPVTVVATTTVTQGTEGDDVVAMEPDAWSRFDALGGNDTICLALPAEVVTDHYGGRDRIGVLDAGAGDDAVVNLMDPAAAPSIVTVGLGAGQDTFTGADVGETVLTDRGQQFGPATPALTGPQADTVTKAGNVVTAAPTDGPNHDRITLGTRAGRVTLDGPVQSPGLLDFTSATEVMLEVPSPAGLSRQPQGELVVDNGTRTVTVGGAQALSWVGQVDSFVLGNQDQTSLQAVSFRGTDADEAVTVAGVPVGEVSLGAGDDGFAVQSYNDTFVPRSADGGPGTDTFSLDNTCYDLVVRLGSTMTCNGIDSAGSLAGFEDVVVSGGTPATRAGVVRLVGTSRGERLVASGQLVAVRGGGGADEIGVADSYRARVFAGTGADDAWVSGDDVVVRGQGGRDRIRLLGSAGLSPVGDAGKRQQVALGGGGRDVLVGTTGDRDRLVGGPGKDRADGRKGRRDFCAAEVTLRCERP